MIVMVNDSRSRMVDSAVVLLAKHGLQATSFAEVLEHSGAPRGSIYHHFPDGKDQLIAAAISLAGERAISLLDDLHGSDAQDVTAGFLGMWRAVLRASDFGAGCSVLAVTVAADSPPLLAAAGDIFRSWRARLAELLEHGGVAAAIAPALATLIIASSEGAVVLSRAERSFAPFDEVSEQLRVAVEAARG